MPSSFRHLTITSFTMITIFSALIPKILISFAIKQKKREASKLPQTVKLLVSVNNTCTPIHTLWGSSYLKGLVCKYLHIFHSGIQNKGFEQYTRLNLSVMIGQAPVSVLLVGQLPV